MKDVKEEIDSAPSHFPRDEVRRLEARLQSLGEEVSKERVDALNALAWEVGFHDIARTESLAREAIEAARALSYPGGLAWGLLNSAFRDYFVGDYESTLEKTRAAIATFEELDDRGGLGNCHTGRGLAFWSLGDFERAVESLHHAIEMFAELEASEREGLALTSLGGVYENVEVLGEETATKLRNLQTQLESETLEKLRNAQAKLIQSARMATLGKLAAGIAHEINTPVGVVNASADVAGRAVAKLVEELAKNPELESDSRIQSALTALESHRTIVEQAARRLSEIVSNLRRLTNLDQAELQFADFNENLEPSSASSLPGGAGASASFAISAPSRGSRPTTPTSTRPS